MTTHDDTGLSVRLANPTDLAALESIELACFPSSRRSSHRSLARSLRSPKQAVAVVVSLSPEGLEVVIGAVILFVYAKSLRLYSIGTLPAFRRSGAGDLLLNWAYNQVSKRGFQRISLEADSQNEILLGWYRKHGFSIEAQLPDYYGPGEHAVRMVRRSKQQESASRVALVMDVPSLWPYDLPNVTAISPSDYLSDPAWQRSDTLRVINLCSRYIDQSMGYYTSLLAAARGHRIMPDVIAIKDMTTAATRKRLSQRYRQLIQQAIPATDGADYVLPIIFESALTSKQHDLAKRLSRSVGAPLLKVTFRRLQSGSAELGWQIQQIKPLSLREAMTSYPRETDAAVAKFFAKRRFQNIKLPSYRYDLAILVNPEEANAPSCPIALDRIQQAAERKGFYVERITTRDRRRLPEFDALLIRETTAVNHPTYRMSREAITEGLIVIDDPWSILRCANKIFLYERLTRARIRQPKAWLFYAHGDWRTRYPDLPFPLVIKRPEGCFSTGVFRVDSPQELDVQLKSLFEEMDVVIGQEFLPSDFDWRIGILNHQPLFACKYYMATGHWQVYNWSSTEDGDDGFHKIGDSECVAIGNVPPAVIQAAKRAAACVGNGLYGVDLKESGGKVYVIEVNDNPNIDAGVEDIVEGERLYERLAEDLARRIEQDRINMASEKPVVEKQT